MKTLIGDLEDIFPNEHLMKYISVGFFLNFFFWQVGSLIQLTDNFIDAKPTTTKTALENMDIALCISYTLAYCSDLALCCILVYMTLRFSEPIDKDQLAAGYTLEAESVPLINFLEDFT